MHRMVRLGYCFAFVVLDYCCGGDNTHPTCGDHAACRWSPGEGTSYQAGTSPLVQDTAEIDNDYYFPFFCGYHCELPRLTQ
jgi:hypothetical protein